MYSNNELTLINALSVSVKTYVMHLFNIMHLVNRDTVCTKHTWTKSVSWQDHAALVDYVTSEIRTHADALKKLYKYTYSTEKKVDMIP